MGEAGMEAGAAALAALDRALAANPREAEADYAAATRHLCLLRDAVIASDGVGRAERLAEVNGIISCSLAGYFPIGKVPTDSIRAAREALRHLLADATG